MPEPIIVENTSQIGEIARASRKAMGMGLREAAPKAGVGTRFLSEFEKGKPSVELSKALDALHAAGLDLAIVQRRRGQGVPEGGYSQRVKTEFPYDWSNSQMEEGVFIRKVLEAARYNDVLRTVSYFGFDRVSQEMAHIESERLVGKLASMFGRIQKGQILAQSERQRHVATS